MNENASPEPAGTKPKKAPVKTPAYTAMHAARYKRQELIRKIEQITGRQLICYVGGLKTLVNRDDVLFMVDLLHNVTPEQDLDLLLHTPGGDMDAAEKLITMVRLVVGTATLRVVIPDFAKSAGTLMALGADLIVMSDSSEIGPIDPQIVTDDGQGNHLVMAIQNYLDAYEAGRTLVNGNPDDVAARLMFQKFDPARVQQFKAAMARATALAESLLIHGMFRSPQTGNFTQVTSKLMDTKKWQSHSQMIGHEDAGGLGLFVEYLKPDDDLWQLHWQLYCLQRMEIQGERQKLYESNYVSLCVEDPN